MTIDDMRVGMDAFFGEDTFSLNWPKIVTKRVCWNMQKQLQCILTYTQKRVANLQI
jgi:hypothetical protein